MSKARGLADLGNVYNDGALSNRNLIINGAMTVAQRGTSVAGVTSAGYRTHDRFEFAVTSLGTWTVSQAADAPSGFANSIKMEVTTANATPAAGTFLFLNHKIEGQDLQQLAKGTADAKPMVLSFWVKSNKTGTYQVSLQDNDNARMVSGTYTVDVSGTWEYKTIAVPADTAGAFDNDANVSLNVEWWFDSGSDFTGGVVPTAWETLNNLDRNAGSNVNLADTIGNYIQITGVQLEVGDTATPFEHRSFDQEHTLCQRYFQRYGGGDTSGIFAIGAWSSSSLAECTVSFVHEMRVPPTVTSPQLGRCLDVNVAWNNVTSIATIAQNSTKNTTLQVNTQTGTAAQGDSAQLGGGGNTFDYLFDSEL